VTGRRCRAAVCGAAALTVMLAAAVDGAHAAAPTDPQRGPHSHAADGSSRPATGGTPPATAVTVTSTLRQRPAADRPLGAPPGFRPFYWSLPFAIGVPYDGTPAASPDEAAAGSTVTLAPTHVDPAAESSSIQPLEGTPRPPQSSALGSLLLELTPDTTQVFIDGFYVGPLEDARATSAGLSLAAGWHRVELRAPGFETLAFNVTIEPNRTVRWRGALTALRP